MLNERSSRGGGASGHVGGAGGEGPGREGVGLVRMLGRQAMAGLLGVSVRTLNAMEARGELPPRRGKSGARAAWRSDDYERWVRLGQPSREAFERGLAGPGGDAGRAGAASSRAGKPRRRAGR